MAPSPSLKAILRAWKRFEAHAGIDVLLQNRVGILGSDLLDLHAAGGRSHEHRLAFGAIDQNAEIKFFLDGQRFFDQQAAHDAAFGAGLMRDQLHAQHLAGEIGGLVHRLGDLHAAAFAAASGVDLRLHHDSGCAGTQQLFGDRFGFLARAGHRSARNCHTIFLENCFCLVLMNFHNDDSSVKPRKEPACGVAARAANF